MSDSLARPRTTWADYRRLYRTYLLVYLGGFVLALVLVMILQRIAPQSLKFGFPAVGILWMVATGITGFRCRQFRCPRCGERFFAKSWAYRAFTKECLHCELPKWAEGLLPEEKP